MAAGDAGSSGPPAFASGISRQLAKLRSCHEADRSGLVTLRNENCRRSVSAVMIFRHSVFPCKNGCLDIVEQIPCGPREFVAFPQDA